MPENPIYRYTLPSGGTIEIENLPETKRGPRDVSRPEDDVGPVPFDSVISPIGEVCNLVFEKLKSIKAPETISLELSASLKGKTSFVLVSGETQGMLKITLTWKRPAE